LLPQIAGQFDRWKKEPLEQVALSVLRLRVGCVLMPRVISSIADKDFKCGQRLLEDIVQFTMRPAADVLCSAPEICPEVQRPALQTLGVLEAEVRRYQLLGEALYSYNSGCATLEHALLDSEHLEVALVEVALDTLRGAANMARGVDGEILCLINVKVAEVFVRILISDVNKKKGRELLQVIARDAQVVKIQRQP